jgi:nitroreductase
MSSSIQNPVTDAILERRSIRAYTEAQLTEAQLTTLLDAGLWAPTARNEQELLFVVLQDPAVLGSGYTALLQEIEQRETEFTKFVEMFCVIW